MAIETSPAPPLTPREAAIANAIAMGRTYKQIARDLNISHKTVATHRAHILNKIGMRTNAELAVHVRLQAQPDYRQALANLVAVFERIYEESEGRWPAADINCPVCTEGCAPTKELCALHAATRLLAVKS